jgi:GntR family transcriptional regulator/MocR family aminotransferase
VAVLKGPVDLLVELDRGLDTPLHEQVERSLRDGIRGGRLQAGAQLPSTRRLASELGVSRGVVSTAYDQLAAEGYLQTRQGAPVRVAVTVRTPEPRPPAPSLVPRFAYDFHPGLPDLAGFPRDRWLRSLRAAWRDAPLDAIGDADPRGVPALREALAEYLGRVRGAAADPEHLLVCTGFRQGLSLTCRWLRDHGVEEIALEEPGWHAARLVVEQAGLRVVAVPVDADGIDVGELARTGAQAVVVTPAHQFPTGAVLSRERRAALIEWAERGDHLIVEDDYDAELRYDRGSVGALQGLAPERVLYIGSAGKRLAPGMRMGWMLLPSWLSWPVIAAKAVEDAGTDVLAQLTLGDFIVRGELDRHLRRMRLRYQSRLAALRGALARELPGWRETGDAAGLFTLARLPAGLDEHGVIAAAATRGVGLEGLALHCYTGASPPGIVLGFGSVAEPAIEQGVRLLAAALGDSSLSSASSLGE